MIKYLKPQGRLFFTTDVHGEIYTLLEGLLDLGFDFKKDTLVCAGDLIDRGRYNEDTLNFFYHNQANFHTIIGNHEMLMCDETQWRNWLYNGGDWILDTSFDDTVLTTIKSFLNNTPFTIEVDHLGYTYGVVHAGVPVNTDWRSFKTNLMTKDDIILHDAVWDRDIIHHYVKYGIIPPNVKGVDYVIHGHTPLKQPTIVGNRVFMDTGLVYNKHLTIAESTIDGLIFHKVCLISKLECNYK